MSSQQIFERKENYLDRKYRLLRGPAENAFTHKFTENEVCFSHQDQKLWEKKEKEKEKEFFLFKLKTFDITMSTYIS